MTHDQLSALANEMFDEILTKVEGPKDAAELVLYLHALIWVNTENKAPVEEMLTAHREAFLHIIGSKFMRKKARVN